MKLDKDFEVSITTSLMERAKELTKQLEVEELHRRDIGLYLNIIKSLKETIDLIYKFEREKTQEEAEEDRIQGTVQFLYEKIEKLEKSISTNKSFLDSMKRLVRSK